MFRDENAASKIKYSLDGINIRYYRRESVSEFEDTAKKKKRSKLKHNEKND